VQQLNVYLELLPCLYQSNRVTKTTKKVRPIDNVNLVGHILCMCPGTWQVQYELKADTDSMVSMTCSMTSRRSRRLFHGARTAQEEGEGKP